jgi:peptidyl-prolyl cis-trans isomerase A (cyclophilin A)
MSATRRRMWLAALVLAVPTAALAQGKNTGPMPSPQQGPIAPPELDGPSPSADGFLGAWKATLVATYSTCVDVKVGQKRQVQWTLAAEKSGALAVAEKGGAKADPTRYTGKLAADGKTLELRAGTQAGLDLVVDGANALSGRHVAVRKGSCAVVYDAHAERATDVPQDVGDKDPDAGNWTLDKALVGLPAGKQLFADITTDAGAVTCELFPDRAPATVANFVGLARGLRAWKDPKTGRWWRYKAYYDGLGFHRVIPGFIVQGGDPLSRDWSNATLGTGGPGYTIVDEIGNGLRFDQPGRLAMANKGPATASAGSQFFIAEVKAPQLDGGYTIFGQCGPAEAIQKTARVPSSAQTNKPDMPLLMKIVIRR